MARLLLNLRNVPDDEAHEVRSLLNEHGIDFYETPPSRWGISMGGIWLHRDDELHQARRLLADYHAQRAVQARELYEHRKRNGDVDTFATVLRRRPAEVLMAVAVAGGILALMLWPVWILL